MPLRWADVTKMLESSLWDCKVMRTEVNPIADVSSRYTLSALAKFMNIWWSTFYESHRLRNFQVASCSVCHHIVIISYRSGDLVSSSPRRNKFLGIFLLLFPIFTERSNSGHNRNDHKSKWDERPNDTPAMWGSAISFGKLSRVGAIDLAENEIIAL